MDNLSSKEEKLQAFSRLLDIMDELREKCPWDKKQTLESLRHLTIEETYELTDAIIKNDLKELQKELGDVLLHIVFYARITSEMGEYDISHVIHTLCEKLIVRHPHIYGDVKVGFDWATSEQVWGKVHEELEELKEELVQPDNKLKSEQEFGDLLFALINLARKSGLNPDDALEYTNQKFITRFMFIEERAKSMGKLLTDMSLEEMDGIWNEAKSK
jgi:XTP/dITP diphosphohydrolase